MIQNLSQQQPGSLILVEWISELFNKIISINNYWSSSYTPIISQLIDRFVINNNKNKKIIITTAYFFSVTFFVSTMPQDFSQILSTSIQANPKIVLALTTSFQSACGYAIIRLLTELKCKKALSALLDLDCNAWHQGN